MMKVKFWIIVPALFSLIGLCSCSATGVFKADDGRIPVIFDTDIGDDIDDTWALITLLHSPELDIKLITTSVGEVRSKAKVVARICEIAGRSDIPIGVGVKSKRANAQKEWVADYDISKYPGKVYDDGVQAMIDTIMKSRGPIKVVAVGPLPTVAAALERNPKIAEKAEFVGMHGSIRFGYRGGKPKAEYNVRAFPKASQKVFTAAWPMTITPLDTCGRVRLKGEKYQRIVKADTPLSNALIENYRIWARNVKWAKPKQVPRSSTTLFDTVAIYLALTKDFGLVEMEDLAVRVTDQGRTIIDEKCKVIKCATKWKDMGAFEDWLIARIIK
ncbi:MAG: nucleoside hydrolase [Planctomycetota bacterium]